MLITTALYAGLTGLLAIWLSAQCGILRARKSIDAGDGGNPELLTAMRRHANFAEQVPLALLLIGMLEVNGVGRLYIHGLGLTLVAGRLLHAVFFTRGVQSVPRGIGAGLTSLVVAVAAIWNILNYVLR